MIDLENPPPGVMATKMQKIVRKLSQNAPARSETTFPVRSFLFRGFSFLAKHWNLTFLKKHVKYIWHLIWHNVKYIWHIVWHANTKNDWILSNRLCRCFYSNKTIWQPLSNYEKACQILCQIIWHRVKSLWICVKLCVK